jgi:hypothetical protein
MDYDCDSKCFFGPTNIEKEILTEETKILMNMRNAIIDALTKQMSSLKVGDLNLKEAIVNRPEPVVKET